MSLLQNTMAKSGTSDFYNGVATTSFRNDPGVVLTDECDAPTSAKIMSFGGWVKRNKIGHYSNLFSGSLGGSGVPQSTLYFDTDNALKSISYTGSAYVYDYRTTQLFRDTSAWYHIWVQIDTTDGTQTDRFKLYANGVRITSFSNAGLIADGSPDIRGFNEDGITAYFGHTNTSYGGNVYYSDWYFIDGSAVSPVDTVGKFKNGVFIPKSYSPTFGNNGFNLKFDQVGVGSPSSSTIGADSSGSSRHFISTAGTDAVASDCAMPDSPENNFAHFNPLQQGSGLQGVNGTLSDGNLKTSNAGSGKYSLSNWYLTSGVWYWEYLYLSKGSNHFFGMYDIASNVGRGWDSYDGGTINAANTLSGGSIAAGNIISFIMDLDGGTLKCHINGTLEATYSFTNNGGGYTPMFGKSSSSGTDVIVLNHGQDGTFAGNKTAQGNTDANGKGNFFYEPSAGLAMCTFNIPEPTIGPNSTTQADDHFNIKLYVGNGYPTSNGQTIDGVGFQSDWTWIKDRSRSGYNHYIFDSFRGATKRLLSNYAHAEATEGTSLTSWNSDGFVLGANNEVNYQNDNFVAWNWRANGGTATATISESGNNPAASVQANPTAGFSIITYTGTGAAGTIAHGLGAVPKMIICKNRNNGDNNAYWAVYHGENTAAPATDYLILNDDAVTADGDGFWNDTAPTSSVFTVNTNNTVNRDGYLHVAYVFAEVEGYSKFGSYKGNGDTDGTYVFTGFRPRYIMVKVASDQINASGWQIYDTARNPNNVIPTYLFANTGDAESDTASAYINLDIVSNGFKIRAANTYGVNQSGTTYIYMAFAEQPFKYANAK